MSYAGPTICPDSFLKQIEEETLRLRNCGFTLKTLGKVDTFPIYWLERPAITDTPTATVLLSAGVHGDEPAAPLSILQLLTSGYLETRQDIHWRISPMLNPTGFAANIRENASGIDLNRDFLDPKSREVQLLCRQLSSRGPSDLALLLHEDWETHGFYLYDLSSNPSRKLAHKIIQKVSDVSPIDRSDEIDGMPSKDGIIHVDTEKARSDPKLAGQWPEAFYLRNEALATFQYTIESASMLDMECRIHSLSTAIQTAVNELFPD